MLENSLGYKLGRGITNNVLFPLGRGVGGAAWTLAGDIGRGGYNTLRGADWRGMGNKAQYLWGNRREIAMRVGRGSRAAYGATIGRDVKFWLGKNPSRIFRKGYKAGIGGRMLAKSFGPLLALGSAAYEVSQADNAAEGIMRGGAELGAIAAGEIGASIGAGMLSFIPGVGTIAGGLIGFGIGYGLTKAAFGLGFKDKQAPKFEDVYMNRRALTMRQASMMELAKSSRSAFGNEAQMMHLR